MSPRRVLDMSLFTNRRERARDSEQHEISLALCASQVLVHSMVNHGKVNQQEKLASVSREKQAKGRYVSWLVAEEEQGLGVTS